MTDDQELKMQALMLKGMMADASPEDQAKVKETCEKLRAVLKEAGDLGVIAITLVGIEVSQS